MRFKAILFDLDGTLLDTLIDLANSMNAALARLGFPTHPVDAYRFFVGDSVKTEARRAMPAEHVNNETVSKCLALAREEYAKCWANNTKPYPGIPELLTELEKLGLPKAVLSNKPDDFTKLNVEKLLGDWSFKSVIGLRPSALKKPNPASALEIADELKVPPSRFIYLGDTDTDMQTAVAAGMYLVGALWGFRTKEELLESGAKTLVQHPLDVLELLEIQQ